MILDPLEASQTLKKMLQYYTWFHSVGLEGDAKTQRLVIFTIPGRKVDKHAVPEYWKGYMVESRLNSTPRSVLF